MEVATCRKLVHPLLWSLSLSLLLPTTTTMLLLMLLLFYFRILDVVVVAIDPPGAHVYVCVTMGNLREWGEWMRREAGHRLKEPV